MRLKNQLRCDILFGRIFLVLIVSYLIEIPFPRTAEAESPPTQVWVERFGNLNQNSAIISKKISTDSNGNVYVAGERYNGADYDYATVKYDPNGVLLWTAVYDKGGNDSPRSLTVDTTGNVYVTGISVNVDTNFDFDYATIKYDTNGNQLWVARYDNGGNDVPSKVVLDSSGNIYVTGTSLQGGHSEYATIKYNPNDGSALWVARNAGVAAGARDVAVDLSGNVYVTGGSCDPINQFSCSNFGYATIKYSSSNGTQIWMKMYRNGTSGSDGAYALSLDTSGNIYVTGLSFNGATPDYATLKYDSDGNQVWINRYDNGDYDQPTAISTDVSGNVYVTGYSSNGIDYDYASIKYDTNGNSLWVARYDNGGYDLSQALSLDTMGNLYVTGSSIGTNDDYATIKYDAAGNQLWAVRFNNGGNDVATGVAVDHSGNIYVTGFSQFDGVDYDYTTIKYAPAPDIPPYAFGGFLPPLTENGTYKLGRTLPIKFELFDDVGGEVQDAVAHLFLQKLSGTEPVGDPIEASSTSGGDSGNLFRFDGGQYIFNLDTRPLSAGTWQLRVMIDDGSTHTIEIGLKAK